MRTGLDECSAASELNCLFKQQDGLFEQQATRHRLQADDCKAKYNPTSSSSGGQSPPGTFRDAAVVNLFDNDNDTSNLSILAIRSFLTILIINKYVQVSTALGDMGGSRPTEVVPC